MLLCGCMDWIIVQTQSCRPWTEERCALSCLEPQSLYHCLGSSLSRHISLKLSHLPFKTAGYQCTVTVDPEYAFLVLSIHSS